METLAANTRRFGCQSTHEQMREVDGECQSCALASWRGEELSLGDRDGTSGQHSSLSNDERGGDRVWSLNPGIDDYAIGDGRGIAETMKCDVRVGGRAGEHETWNGVVVDSR